MIYYQVTYKSGREESIPCASSKKAKDTKRDLQRAYEMGHVSNFKEMDEKQHKESRKRVASVGLPPADFARYQARSVENGTSMAEEIRRDLGVKGESAK